MNRRARLAVGGAAAVLIAGALVAPVVISDGGSGGSCAMTLSYSGELYAVRRLPGTAPVQDRPIGVGVTRGCGAEPQNVDVRSLAGVSAYRAIAVSGDPDVWVGRRVCARAAASALLSCLTR